MRRRCFAPTRGGIRRFPHHPDLKNQYTDVYTVGVERQLASSWALQITGIFKRWNNFKGTVNEAVPFSSWNPITVTNPLNGQPLNIYTLRPQFLGIAPQIVLTNPGERPGDTEPLRRTYDGVEFVLRRQYRDGWLFQAWQVYGNGAGNVPNNFGGSAIVNYQNPNSLVNRYDDLLIGPRHQTKIFPAATKRSGASSSAATTRISPATPGQTTSVASV